MTRTLALLFVPSVALAFPLELTWSGRVVDASGTPLEGVQPVTIQLCADDTNPCTLFDQYYSPVFDSGYVSIRLAISTEALDQEEVWVQVVHDETPLLPRHRLASVPYAHLAGGVALEPAPATAGCVGQAGAMVYDTTRGNLRVCDGTTWQYVGRSFAEDDNGAYRYPDGTALLSCAAYLSPPSGYAPVTEDGRYWIDPDGPAGEAAFQVWCDQTLDGGGWLLAGWGTGNGFDGQSFFTTYDNWGELAGSSATVTPSATGFASWINDIDGTFPSTDLDVRQTYRKSLDQTTLNITTPTTRGYSTGSTWRGEVITNNPLPSTARGTVGHNCESYHYINASGTESTPSLGCYIEYTNGHSGSWAGCGSNAYDTSGAAFNLCFDDGAITNSEGNALIALWHTGRPSYHEVYEHNYKGSTPANSPDGWGSPGGQWTWSVWIRPG